MFLNKVYLKTKGMVKHTNTFTHKYATTTKKTTSDISIYFNFV